MEGQFLFQLGSLDRTVGKRSGSPVDGVEVTGYSAACVWDNLHLIVPMIAYYNIFLLYQMY